MRDVDHVDFLNCTKEMICLIYFLKIYIYLSTTRLNSSIAAPG